jgi:hypothetical protein
MFFVPLAAVPTALDFFFSLQQEHLVWGQGVCVVAESAFAAAAVAVVTHHYHCQRLWCKNQKHQKLKSERNADQNARASCARQRAAWRRHVLACLERRRVGAAGPRSVAGHSYLLRRPREQSPSCAGGAASEVRRRRRLRAQPPRSRGAVPEDGSVVRQRAAVAVHRAQPAAAVQARRDDAGLRRIPFGGRRVLPAKLMRPRVHASSCSAGR